jgi:hypothetical protein
MKMKGRISILALTVVLILGLGAATALASNVTYLGKTTWTATITDSFPDATKITGTFTVTGGISKVGDEFYLFQGYVIPSGDGPFVMSGSGFMNGSTLVFTLSESQQHTSETWRDSGVMHIEVDKTNLSGTFYDIGTDFDTGPARTFGNHRYTAGTLTRSGGLIPLAPGLTASQLLLLE